MQNLDYLNHTDTETFAGRLGGIFEHSPWIAQEAAKKRPFSSVDELFEALVDIVKKASHEKREALIQVHPRLGAKEKLTTFSSSEQKQAGLRKLDNKEAVSLANLNAEYEHTFNFPFIMAVRGRSKQEIYAALKERLGNTRAQEFEKALEEIYKIARFRLDDLLNDEEMKPNS